MKVATLESGQEYKVALAKSPSAQYRAQLLISMFGDCSPTPPRNQPSVYVISVKEDDVFRIVGTCSIGRSNNFSSEVFHLCIHDKYRRLGLASQLLDYAISNSTKPFLFSNVHSSNVASRMLFERLGFEKFQTYTKVDRLGENAEFTVYYKSTRCSNE